MSSTLKTAEEGKLSAQGNPIPSIVSPSGKDAGRAATATLTSKYNYGYVASSEEEQEEEIMPWEEDDFIPTMKSGKQKTPNQIRNELQKYIDECKANRTSNQTTIVGEMGINSNSFRRFMNPKTYKNQWSAIDNSTYWAAGKLLERVKYEKEEAKKAAKKAKAQEKEEAKKAAKNAKAGTKRKAADNGDETTNTTTATTAVATAAFIASPAPKKKSKSEVKLELIALIDRILAVPNVSHQNGVYDSCPQVIKKVKDFLARDGMTKKLYQDSLGGINSGSLNKFLSSKGQDECGNVSYRESYEFFEKLRVLEGHKKTKARLKNEASQPKGFSLVKARAKMWILPVHPMEHMYSF